MAQPAGVVAPAPRLQLDVLGPLEGRVGGAELTLGSPQQQAVLAALALREGGQVDLAELVTGLWGDRPPPTAGGTLRTYLSRLRRALGPAEQLLVATGGGYRLVRPSYRLDLDTFHELRRQGAAAASTGDVAAAAGHLRAALELWRGTPLSGLPGPYADAQRDRLAQLRSATVEDLLAAELELGHLPEVLGELAVLVPENPLRERLRELQVLALWRMGRTADALAAYQQARATLAEELGIDPGAALQELQEQLLRGAAAPAPGVPGSAAGPRPVPAQLPGVPVLVTGRRDVLADLAAAAAAGSGRASRVVLVTGMGGVGKTTLAVHLARELAGSHPDGQLYVNLRGFDPTRPPLDPFEALSGFLGALGVRPQELPGELEARTALFRSLLAGRRVVVVLDNARDADQVRPLLPGGPDALVLVTSRSALSGLVATEGAHPVAVDVLDPGSARGFVRERLGAARADAEPAAVDRLVRRTGGLPLALAVVVARAASRPGFPLEVLADELDADPLDAVSSPDGSSDLRTVLSSSYRALTPPEAEVFRSLAGHPGPDAGTAAIASGVGLPAPQVRRLLDQLAEQALVSQPAPGRWVLHDLLLAYAAELTGPAGRRELLLRVTEHHLRTAVAARLAHSPWRPSVDLPPATPGVVAEDVPDGAAAAAWFGRETTVLTATVAQAAAAGMGAQARELALVLLPLQDDWGRPHDALACLRAALSVTDPEQEPGWAGRVHQGLGVALELVGRVESAAEHLRTAVALFSTTGDRRREAQALTLLAATVDHELLPADRRRPDELRTHLRAAIALAVEIGDRHTEAAGRNNLGYHLLTRGQPAEARHELVRAVALAQELGDASWAGQPASNLAAADLAAGRVAEAVSRYRDAIGMLADAGMPQDVASAQLGLGRALRAAGDAAGAEQAWREGLRVLTGVDPTGQVAAAQQTRARLVDALGDLRGAGRR